MFFKRGDYKFICPWCKNILHFKVTYLSLDKQYLELNGWILRCDRCSHRSDINMENSFLTS